MDEGKTMKDAIAATNRFGSPSEGSWPKAVGLVQGGTASCTAAPEAVRAEAKRVLDEKYQEAVLHVYDKAETSEDWLTLRSARAGAGLRWLEVCVNVSKRLDAGEILGEAMRCAFEEMGL